MFILDIDILCRGANPYDADSKGEIALHYAIQAGRTENVEILVKLQTDSKWVECFN